MLVSGSSSSNPTTNYAQPGLLDISGLMFKVNGTRCIILSRACPASLCGSDNQLRTSEMLHWDDYHTQHKIKDGAPSILKMYQPRGVVFEEYCFGDPPIIEQEGLKFRSKSLAVRPEPESSFITNYCAEMQHWDDFCETKGISFGENAKSMSTLFKPFSGRKLMYWDRKDKFTRYISLSVAIAHFDEDHHFYCSEMEHYDDYQAMKKLSSEPSMKKLFGIQA